MKPQAIALVIRTKALHQTMPALLIMSDVYEEQQRQRLYKLLQVANRELKKILTGWCDDDYRNVLRFCGAKEKQGRISATTMSITDLERALKVLKDKGFRPQRPRNGGYSKDKQPRINKLMAMWYAMADANVVTHRTPEAMQAWCENNVPGIQKLAWAESHQLNKAIEMMKAFATSRGVAVF